MDNLARVRSVVARFLQISEQDITDSFEFPTHRLQGSLGRSLFRAAIKRIAGVDLPGAMTARTWGELVRDWPAGEVGLLPAQTSTPIAAPPPPQARGGSARSALQIRTGIDIAALSELPADGSAELESFLAEYFSQSEIRYARQRPDPRLSVLGLWAAKEAVLKCGWTDVLKPADITIDHDPRGQPLVRLAPELAAGSQHSVSISHAGEFAISVCIRVDC